MNLDVLLYWASTVGKGSWRYFCDTVVSFCRETSDPSMFCRILRCNLSDLGHIDFFINGSNQWKVKSPFLTDLCGVTDTALLCGARTPALLENIKRITESQKSYFEIKHLDNLPSQISICGSNTQIRKIARLTQLKYIQNYSSNLCLGLKSIIETYQESPIEDAPIKWKIRIFNFHSLKWVEEETPGFATEYTSTYGERKYFIAINGKLRRIGKRESIYVAASLQQITITQYDLPSQKLIVPIAAPLPEQYARVACLCSGLPPRIEDKFFIYEKVTLAIASLLLVRIGQPHPERFYS